MSSSDNAQDRNTEAMLYVHTMYFLFLHGPVKKDEFEEKLFKYLDENNLFFPTDLEVLESRASRSRSEKIYQQLRNLAKSNKSLAPSHFIEETETHYQLSKDILPHLKALLLKIQSKNESPASSELKKLSHEIAGKFRTKNILLVGPPGTGKTRAASIISDALNKGKKLDLSPESLNQMDTSDTDSASNINYYSTQFHPSFSYEDFFEGIRPVQIQNDDKTEVSYSVVPGIFKAISQLARSYIQPKSFGIDMMVQFVKKPDGSYFWDVGENSSVALYRLMERAGKILYKNKDVAYTGGATGISDGELKNNCPEKTGYYQVKWFYCGESENANFVLFIDELNRGNPARIFGEALSLIEDSKRLGRPEQSEIMLPYSHEQFIVPPNLHIICAMNSADKSLANLDQAFRRRFSLIYLAPAFDIITKPEFKEKTKYFDIEILESLKNHFEAINNALKATRVPQENLIGHYFVIKVLRSSYSKINTSEEIKSRLAESKSIIVDIVRFNLKAVWENELHSLLRDILGDNKLQEFCDKFATEISKAKENIIFLTISKDASDSLYKYLENINPVEKDFPWKKAS